MKKIIDISVSTLLISSFLFLSACSSSRAQEPHAKNIIFMIGDGMGLHQVYAAMTVADTPLAFERAEFVGLQKTYSSNKYITDSAAGGTAMACGVKTNNGTIGQDSAGNDLVSILQVAEEQGLATGLVSTSAITHATPASFIAHESSRGDEEEIALDFLDVDIDLFIGGGWEHFAKRKDDRDLTEELKAKGYTVTRTVEELSEVHSGKLAGFTAKGHNPSVLTGRGEMLSIATSKAIEILSQDKGGFFLMIEGSQIDWGGHANSEKYVLTEVLDFNKAIEIALEFAEKHGETLVVVTADHETGGLIIRDGNFEKKKVRTEFNTTGHTGTPVPVYSWGPYAELFTGVFDNTGFKERFIEAYGFEFE